MRANPARQGPVGSGHPRRQAEIGRSSAMMDIRGGHDCGGIERVEVHFERGGFSSHRHDAYAIGMTLSGIQAFRYRGVERRCLPGQCHILHPDEAHDGRAGDNGGFKYRIAYLDPGLIQRAIAGRPLPFVEDPIATLTPEQTRLLAVLWDFADPVDALRQADIAVAVSDVLEALSSPRGRRRRSLCLDALTRVRERIAAAPAEIHTAEELERIAGLDRWTLARQFRAAFGTSPTHFRMMRQLDDVRRLIRDGASLSGASLDAGFFDQSHMSRMFKRAYGVSPGTWLASLKYAGREA